MNDSDSRQWLGPYALQELIGRGPHCRVWRANGPRGEVALKVLEPQFAASAASVEQFVQEARRAMSLEHAHIVRVHEVLTPPESPLPCFAMDLLSGGSLAQLRGAPVGEFATLVRVLSEVCLALEYVHSQGLVHCDIKASNVLLDERRRAHLADFGMAASCEELAEDGTRGGTILYISPEQFASLTEGAAAPGRVDARSDLYSLGVLMYELFTGQAPFTASNRFSLIYQRTTSDPPRPSAVRAEVPVQLDHVILKALARDPADRFQAAAALCDALAEVASTL